MEAQNLCWVFLNAWLLRSLQLPLSIGRLLKKVGLGLAWIDGLDSRKSEYPLHAVNADRHLSSAAMLSKIIVLLNMFQPDILFPASFISVLQRKSINFWYRKVVLCVLWSSRSCCYRRSLQFAKTTQNFLIRTRYSFPWEILANLKGRILNNMSPTAAQYPHISTIKDISIIMSILTWTSSSRPLLGCLQ